jgi:hypothetical protein
MSMQIYEPDLTETELDPIGVGDIVVTGASVWPRYQVVAVADGRVWLRDVQTQMDAIVGEDRCRLAGPLHDR